MGGEGRFGPWIGDMGDRSDHNRTKLSNVGGNMPSGKREGAKGGSAAERNEPLLPEFSPGGGNEDKTGTPRG